MLKKRFQEYSRDTLVIPTIQSIYKEKCKSIPLVQHRRTSTVDSSVSPTSSKPGLGQKIKETNLLRSKSIGIGLSTLRNFRRRWT